MNNSIIFQMLGFCSKLSSIIIVNEYKLDEQRKLFHYETYFKTNFYNFSTSQPIR